MCKAFIKFLGHTHFSLKPYPPTTCNLHLYMCITSPTLSVQWHPSSHFCKSGLLLHYAGNCLDFPWPILQMESHGRRYSVLYILQVYPIMRNNTGRMKRERILETYECGFHWQLKSACFTCTKDICAMFKLLRLLLKSMCCCKEFCKHYKVRWTNWICCLSSSIHMDDFQKFFSYFIYNTVNIITL